jgi:hypothetical protein
MRLERAIEIVERLRDGEDPRTGKPLPTGSPAQEPDVVRALYTVLAALPGRDDGETSGATAELPKPRKPHPSRAGQPWSDAEDTRLGAAFDAGDGVTKLARAFERSAAAVRLRLVKLGRLSAEDVLTSRPRREPAASATE